MFNLIDECGKDLTQYGYTVKKLDRANATLAYLNVDNDMKAEKLGFERGEYFIINTKDILQQEQSCLDYLVGVCKNAINQILEGVSKNKKCLIVGLGNPDILADCFGKTVVDYVNIEDNKNVFKFCPNIYAITNIETYDFVRFIKDGINADLIFVIDALATNEITRLGSSIQITSTGISAGSGVGIGGKRICEETLGVPCISIGVPFMIFADSMVKCAPEGLLLTPKDIHENVEIMALIVAEALSKIL